jgi:hypothetical protein
VAAPAGGVPLAVPVAPPVPAPELAFGAGPLVAGRRGARSGRRGRGSWLPFVLLTVLLVVLLGGGGYAIYRYYDYLNNRPDPRDVENEEKGNFRFRPPRDWEEEPAVARAFRTVQMAYRRSDAGPRNRMALYYRDYQKRSPSDAELVGEGLVKLRNYFSDLEYDVKERDDKFRLGGLPALVMEFQGYSAAPENVFSGGEVWMMTHRGFAYWFFTWGPMLNDQKESVHEQVAAEWPKLRERFATLGYRDGWQEAPRKTRGFESPKGAYRIDYVDNVWSRQKEEEYNATQLGRPPAELVLHGYDPRLAETDKHASKAATATVVVLGKASELAAAVKLAREDLLERQKQIKEENTYLYPETAVDNAPAESIRKDKADDKVGAFEGKLLRLQVTNTPKRIRYVVLGVVNRPEGVLAVQCECAYDQRDFWEQEFLPLLANLGPVKGG